MAQTINDLDEEGEAEHDALHDSELNESVVLRLKELLGEIEALLKLSCAARNSGAMICPSCLLQTAVNGVAMAAYSCVTDAGKQDLLPQFRNLMGEALNATIQHELSQEGSTGTKQ